MHEQHGVHGLQRLVDLALVEDADRVEKRQLRTCQQRRELTSKSEQCVARGQSARASCRDGVRKGCKCAYPRCMGNEQCGDMADLRVTVAEGRLSVTHARRLHGRGGRANSERA